MLWPKPRVIRARVTLVSGPVTLPAPQGIRTIRVETAREMDEAVEQALPADLAIFAAAVADWRVADESSEKRKKDGSAIPPLQLTENPDILARISRHAESARASSWVRGGNGKVLEHAKAKFAAQGLRSSGGE